ncbi:metallophosphoesterase [Maritalea porphyrae]|uniref:metallophosphoesterase n=1 Tax=Maritalea porphyrae TaxID=880732 RepID=UPI0022B06952|nr:metallophosphoesterase [Maritalea porphyrae]MCZ4271829.1 metallophosphoesterase [Maritalea porphyrae]
MFRTIWAKRFQRAHCKVDEKSHLINDDIQTIYAIGDVHGSLDLLKKLEHEVFNTHNQKSGSAALLFLGDFIDRGPMSANLIEHLIGVSPKGFVRLCICGNHELMMKEFLSSPSPDADWLFCGGRETLLSYGIGRIDVDKSSLLYQVLAAIPANHMRFLESLVPYYIWNKFIFTHAGLNPEKGIAEQTAKDTCRNVSSYKCQKQAFGKTIVHGHFIVPNPVKNEAEISLDTAAFATGRLSYAKIEKCGAVELYSITL